MLRLHVKPRFTKSKRLGEPVNVSFELMGEVGERHPHHRKDGFDIFLAQGGLVQLQKPG